MSTKRIISTIAAACAAVTLGSCASTQESRNSKLATKASFSTTPPKVHRERVRGGQVVSVNGRAVGESVAGLTPGLNDVRVRFNWPQGGSSREISLRFQVLKDRRYFLKLQPFPSTPRSTEGTRVGRTLGSAAEVLFTSGEPISGVAGLGLYGAAVPASLLEYGCRVAGVGVGRGEPAEYIDLLVISEKMGEGVVRRVRAFPDGRVDWKTWDAWSNAPGARGGPIAGAGGREDQAPEVLRRSLR